MTSSSVSIEFGNIRTTMREILRADLDGDGTEDILVARHFKAVSGTWGRLGANRLGPEKLFRAVLRNGHASLLRSRVIACLLGRTRRDIAQPKALQLRAISAHTDRPLMATLQKPTFAWCLIRVRYGTVNRRWGNGGRQ